MIILFSIMFSISKFCLLAASSTFALFFGNEAKAFTQTSPPPFGRVDAAKVAPGATSMTAKWAEFDVPDVGSFRPAKSKFLLSPGRGYKEVDSRNALAENKLTSGTQALNFSYAASLPGGSGQVSFDLSQITSPTVAGLAINNIFVSDSAADGLANQAIATLAGNWEAASATQFYEYVKQSTTSTIPSTSKGFVTTGLWAEFRYADFENRVDYVKIVSGFDASDPLDDFVDVETMFNNQKNSFFVRNLSTTSSDSLFTDVFATSPLVGGYDGGEILIDLTFTANAFLEQGPPITHPGGVVAAPAPLPLLGIPIVFGYSRKLRAALKNTR
jgi:hypothetical protein